MPTLIETYASETPLCIYMTDFPQAVWIVAAMVETPVGIAVANGAIFDPWGSKATSLHEGAVTGDGPWEVGGWTFAVFKEGSEAARAWAIFEGIAADEGGWRPRVEAMLTRQYAR